MLRSTLSLGLALLIAHACAESLGPDQLGLVYRLNDPSSERIADYYAARRHIPKSNRVALRVSDRAVLSRDELTTLRADLQEKLPTSVQSLLLIWSRPFAVECMSVTTAFAAGYQPGFCEAGCGRTTTSPLYDASGWLPADSVGWLPAMLLPSADEALARKIIERGIESDASAPSGSVYLVNTRDMKRNVRAAGYADAQRLLAGRVRVVEMAPALATPPADILAYFTGAERVEEIGSLRFHAGAVADHLTSLGGVLEGGSQMSAMEWLKQGATASYGSVSEPCNVVGKFPKPAVFVDHYLRGETLLEAYWKSVAMPGQGLIIGEPLARPYANRP